MLRVSASLLSLAIAFSSAQVFAEEKSQAEETVATTFTLQIPMLAYHSDKTQTSSSRSLLSSSQNSFGWIAHDGWNLYLYPFSDANSVGLSRMFGESWELGTSMTVESSKEGDNSVSENSFFPFVTYYSALANNLTLESILTYEVSEKITWTKDETSGLRTKSKEQGHGASALFYFVYAVNKKLSGVLGVAYGKNETKVTGSESDETKNLSIDISTRWTF